MTAPPAGRHQRFDEGRNTWLARLGNLRNVVRQELVARQLRDALAELLPAGPLTVLDVGCGQGTQSLILARAGHHVTGIDTSPEMLAAFVDALAAEEAAVRERVVLVESDVRSLPADGSFTTYDVVLCHGVLMYLDDPEPALTALCAATGDGGLLSLVARNREAMAMRHGLRRQWARALEAFGATDYVNELGVAARADSIDDLTRRMAEYGLAVARWHGVRVLTDTVPLEELLPPPDELALLLDVEERAGRTDPYRRVAPLVHLLATRP